MAELPSSWGLTAKRNGKKCEVWGKDDAGRDYKVRECGTPSPSQSDIEAIAAVDRTRTTAKEFVGRLMEQSKSQQRDREREFGDSLEEAAGPVVRAGLERKGSAVGYSRAYARGWDRAFA